MNFQTFKIGDEIFSAQKWAEGRFTQHDHEA